MKPRHFLAAGAACVSVCASAWDGKQSSDPMQDRSIQRREREAQLSHTQDQSVRDAQGKLAAQGYDPGPADGKLGPRTQQQIMKFQQDHNLQPSGELDDQTMAALSAQSSSTGSSSTGSSSPSSQSSSNFRYGGGIHSR